MSEPIEVTTTIETPGDVYALVADLTRMGEWSPETTGIASGFGRPARPDALSRATGLCPKREPIHRYGHQQSSITLSQMQSIFPTRRQRLTSISPGARGDLQV